MVQPQPQLPVPLLQNSFSFYPVIPNPMSKSSPKKSPNQSHLTSLCTLKTQMTSLSRRNAPSLS